MNEQAINRLQSKTPERRFLRVLEDEFHQPPRVAQVLLEEARACLLGRASALRQQFPFWVANIPSRKL